MDTMKALYKDAYAYDHMQIVDAPIPEIGDNDILLQVKAAGVCGTDLRLFKCSSPEEMGEAHFPAILGHEFAGVIAKVGKNVKDWEVGARVVSENTGYVCGKCPACARGDFLQCPDRLGLGYGMDGGFTNYVKISGDVLAVYPNCLFAIPDDISFEEAAILDPACNAYKALMQESDFKPGENLVIFGTGPLGLFAVQMGRIMNAHKVIVVGLSADRPVRFPLAQKLGATDIIVGDEEDVEARVLALCGPQGVTTALECSGSNKALYQAIRVVQNGGVVVRVGQNAAPAEFSMNVLVEKAAKLQGHMGYDTKSWVNCLRLISMGLLDMNAMITHRLPLSEWRTAIELGLKQQSAKVILYPYGEEPAELGVQA